MSHVVLLGDSIFDNASYVPAGQQVIEHLRRGLPPGWKATLAARDGHTVEGVASQLANVPSDATHLIVSAGGNDALLAAGLLREPAVTVGDALATVAEALAQFRDAYAAMLEGVLALGKPTAVCTIYDAIPVLGAAERAALAGFNGIISRAAVGAGLPLLDLRVVCNDAGDYAPVSPIEPSATGGAKIANAICRLVSQHDFQSRRTVVWV